MKNGLGLVTKNGCKVIVAKRVKVIIQSCILGRTIMWLDMIKEYSFKCLIF